MRYNGLSTLLLGILVFVGCANEKPTDVSDTISRPEGRHISNNTVEVIYLSTDGGSSWRPYAKGIPPRATVVAFHIMEKTIYTITNDNRIYSIKEGLENWLPVDNDLPANIDINAIISMGEVFILGTSGDGIFISSNNCRNWQNPARSFFSTPIRSLFAVNNTLLAGTDIGIYKSTDYGRTWSHTYKGGQVNGFTEVNDKIYAALVNGGALSVDAGSNWRYIYRPHTLHDISDDGESIYAMTLGAGLMKTKNDGLTWELVNKGLGTYNLYTFEIKNINSKLFAAQWYGIYSSNDGGKNWAIVKDGLPDSTAFTTLEVFGSNLIAGIGGRKESGE